jgi:hypothetical protein
MRKAAGLLMATVLVLGTLTGCLDGNNEKDKLPKEIEKNGWYINVTYAGENASTRIKVDSDPDMDDTDGDGLTDYQEWQANAGGGRSNPRDIDTDGDGLTDEEEAQLGTHPASWMHDHDQDNGWWQGDYEEILYYQERGLDHETIVTFLQDADVDNDGIKDGHDIDPLHDLRIQVHIVSLYVSANLDPNLILEIVFTVSTDQESQSAPESPLTLVIEENTSVNLSLTMDFSDQGIPGEYANSISISVIDQDEKVGEPRYSDAIDGDGFIYMDFVQITSQGSFTNNEFDIRNDCHTYFPSGPDGRILFRIDDVSIPWS